jgi:hypothetical protein
VSILVDSSVLLDIWAEQAEWWEWSSSNLARLGERSVLNINPIIYAEVSPRFASLAELDAAIRPIGLDRVDLPWDAAFLGAEALLSTAGAAAPALHHCLTSTSARMPWFRV